LPAEGESIVVSGRTLTSVKGILRASDYVSDAQMQTRESFGFKWAKRDTFEDGVADYLRQWLIEKYDDVPNASWFGEHDDSPVVLDAGCGASPAALAFSARSSWRWCFDVLGRTA
jgi:arsenite methyltransferase